MSVWRAFIDRNLFRLVHLKGLLTNSWRRSHYGQWGEDALIAGLFPKKNDGFYVDVGAYHPFHYSNTFLLHKRGWRGVNIDPNPDSIALFRFHRPSDANLNYGIAEEGGERDYYVFNHQSCNTFSKEQRDKMLSRPFMRLVKETRVPCAPLSSLLTKHANGKTIDLLNVDVEGMGLAVLRSLDWKTQAPKVICVEDDDLQLQDKGFGSPIHSFLIERGYALRHRAGASSLYVHP